MNEFLAGWMTALSEAWNGYLYGSYPIGACVVDADGKVLARGRNRLNEPRRAHAGVIGGHDLAHAEINALLDIPEILYPDCRAWTVLATLEPCPQCAGAIAMSGIRGVQYAAPDPWGGCARLLRDDPYMSRWGQMQVGRAPRQVEQAALRLALVGFLETGQSAENQFMQSFAGYSEDFQAAQRLYSTGTLAALRTHRAGLAEALAALLDNEIPVEWVEFLSDPLPGGEGLAQRGVRGQFPDLSPGLHRTGRACAWIERGDGCVLMIPARAGWTLPGGGIEPGETPQQAALREAWEEAGVRGEATGEGWTLDDGADSVCVPLRMVTQESSPEGLPVIWVNPHALPWADDLQLRQVLAARGQTPPHLALPPLVARAYALARREGFDRSCSSETGRLLCTLAAGKPGGRLLELGSGLGAGAAWLLAGMDAASTLLTVENDESRIEHVSQLLSGTESVRVHGGDWQEVIKDGPYDLIFADCAPAKGELAQLETLVAALKRGGLLVMDNFSPPAYLPEHLYAGDPLREALFSHPQLHTTELQVGRRERVILATLKSVTSQSQK